MNPSISLDELMSAHPRISQTSYKNRPKAVGNGPNAGKGPSGGGKSMHGTRTAYPQSSIDGACMVHSPHQSARCIFERVRSLRGQWGTPNAGPTSQAGRPNAIGRQN